MAPPGAQGGELHGGGRREGRWHGGRLWGELELVAAAEMPHLGCCSSVTASQRQGHLVVVRDLCGQGNLWGGNRSVCPPFFLPYILRRVQEFMLIPEITVKMSNCKATSIKITISSRRNIIFLTLGLTWITKYLIYIEFFSIIEKLPSRL